MDKKEKAPPAAKPANLTDNSCTQSKPNVLILGGCGFIGRNLVKYLVDNDLVNLIRVADKKLPIISNMNKEHSEAFKNKNVVNFVQADLSKDSFIKKIFEKDGHTWNYVVNLCGETRFGLSENEYIERSFQPARLAGEKQT